MATQLDEGRRIPSNIAVTPVLRPLIERLVGVVHVQGQCARLEQAPSMLADTRFGNASHLSARRGRTDCVRPSRDITRADICVDLELRSVAQLVETIAHELGHVVE
jgi:hypothetical protein